MLQDSLRQALNILCIREHSSGEDELVMDVTGSLKVSQDCLSWSLTKGVQLLYVHHL